MTTLEIVSILVAIAAVFGWISVRWLRLPITVGTMLLTVVASLSLVGLGGVHPPIHDFAVGLVRRINLESLILQGMLPLLLFAGSFLLDLDQLAREKFAVSIFAIVGTVTSIYLVAGLVWLIAGTHASWIECLIFGALISPTDPIAVLEMLRRTGVPQAIRAQLAGESLFNDGIGAVFFLTMVEVARGHAPGPLQVTGMLFAKAGGGIMIGIAGAWITSQLMRHVNSYQIDILLSLSLAFNGYVLADFAQVSGPLEAVAAGIALRFFNRSQPGERISHEDVDAFWKVVDEVQNSLLFVLLGLEIMAVPLDLETLRSGGAAILSVTAVRFGVVILLLAIVRLFSLGHRSSVAILTWGGLRGGLSIALALSVPEALGRSWMVGATYLVVVFSIVIQGGSMDRLVRWRHMLRARAQARKATPAPAHKLQS
ncbi:MAG TPA: sodium:proton antiporter [Terracidiphilus sp.]|nr:sodium:proton antiporter [Terracidiphilus sp.]